MSHWMIFSLFALLFLGTGFIGTWVIREGGSLAFLWPSFLRNRPAKREPRE